MKTQCFLNLLHLRLTQTEDLTLKCPIEDSKHSSETGRNFIRFSMKPIENLIFLLFTADRIDKLLIVFHKICFFASQDKIAKYFSLSRKYETFWFFLCFLSGQVLFWCNDFENCWKRARISIFAMRRHSHWITSPYLWIDPGKRRPSRNNWSSKAHNYSLV